MEQLSFGGNTQSFRTGLTGVRGARRLPAWLGLALIGVLVCPARAATLVHRPYLQNTGRDHVTVVWSARENQSAAVQYSSDRSFSQSVAARVRVFTPSVTGMSITFYQYQADLTGLREDTAYSYRVMMDGQDVTSQEDRQFRTAAPPGRVTFLAFGDSGLGTPPQRDIAAAMDAEQPDLVIHVGDIAYEDGTFDQFTANYFEYYWTIMRRAPFFPVPGNHEYNLGPALPYLALNRLPEDTVPAQDRGRYYSYDWGGIHFVALDSNLLAAGYSADAMLDWLEQDLVASSAARWRIAYFHHLPYPIFHHLTDPICAAARDRIVPILERHAVQLVLVGHEHTYQRSKTLRAGEPVTSGPATVYVVTGGGGGTLHPVVSAPFLEYEASVYHYLRVEVDATQITIHAIGQDRKEFDTVTLAQPSISPGAPVVNAASFTAEIAAGGLISIFGKGLASGTRQAAGYPLPTALAGTTVTVDGTPSPLTYVSPQQINAQLPLDSHDSATLRITTASGFAEIPIGVSDTAPAIFQGGILHLDGRPVSAQLPALPGETLAVYGTGFGPVDGPIGDGTASPSSPLLHVSAPVSVQMGDVSLTPLFAGLTPGLAGVYQVNVVVPADLPSRVYTLRVVAKGNSSNVMNVQVQGKF